MARVFSDAGQSAKTADRDAFQNMFRYLEANPSKISHIVVYKYNRFSRNVDGGAEYRMRLRKLGVMLRSAIEATDDTPAGKLFANMLGMFAQFDNNSTGEPPKRSQTSSVILR